MKIWRTILIGGITLIAALNQLSVFAAINERGLNKATAITNKGNYREAYSHFMKMAKQGCPYSQCVIGIMHQKGVGTEKDMQQAIFWLEKSATQGFSDAERRLGKIHLNGEGVERNVELASQWLDKASRHGEVEAQYELGKLDVSARGSEALNQGRAWLKEAASHGYVKAKELLEQLPPVPEGNYQVEPNNFAEGLSNIQTSWSGYAHLAHSLDSATTNEQ